MRQDTALSLPQQQARATAGGPIRGILDPARPGFRPARSLYIHVPFCFHKCHYCDFYSLVDTRDRQAPFTDRLSAEFAALAPCSAGAPLETIFVGGGTPSLLRPELWSRVLASLHRHFDLSLIVSGSGEFTVECNPETVTDELTSLLRAGGVNRLSFGAQSFHTRHLKTLERWHDPDNVARALESARRAGIPRLSLDLIFAIPGQTLDDWARDLQTALALNTDHLSCYSLTYEPNTAMTVRKNRGEFAPADEDLEVDMQRLALDTLRSRGLDRYEVSNFARPGSECRHNLAYWRQEQWLAAGPSASAHVAGHRWKNIARLDDYLSISDEGFAPITDHEPSDPARAIAERLMTGLRLREGLDAPTLLRDADKAAPGSAPRLDATATRLESAGKLRRAADRSGLRWILTDDGILFADGIAVEFMAALDEPLR